MKKYFWQIQTFTFLTILIMGTASIGQVKKDLPKETVSEKIPAGQPKLIKNQNSQSGANVNSSLQDKAGNLWFGTTGEGLYKYDGKSFTQFTATKRLNSNIVYCILEDTDGKIWIGTEAGVCLYDGKTFAEIQIPLRKNLPPNKVRSTHGVFSIMQDKHGKLWFATIDGVSIYDGKTFTPFSVNEGAGGFMSSNNNVERILEDNDGNIWFGGRGNKGVFRYDGKSLANLKPDGDNWAWPVLQDKNGNIWFSNWSGAYRFDGNTFVKIGGLPSVYGPITRIIEDNKGNLWFGVSGRGICRYDGKNITCFTEKEGLTNNNIWSILEDSTGNLWVGTGNTGLYRFDGKTFTDYSK